MKNWLQLKDILNQLLKLKFIFQFSATSPHCFPLAHKRPCGSHDPVNLSTGVFGEITTHQKTLFKLIMFLIPTLLPFN